jgi:hypothetical protein
LRFSAAAQDESPRQIASTFASVFASPIFILNKHGKTATALPAQVKLALIIPA